MENIGKGFRLLACGATLATVVLGGCGSDAAPPIASVTPSRKLCSGAGSAWWIWCMMAACCVASNGGRPAIRWYSTAASE